MSDTFKVGEIAIGQNFIYYPELNGRELLVIGGLRRRVGMSRRSGIIYDDLKYLCDTGDGQPTLVGPMHLRRKPPADDSRAVTRWADCPWQPEKVQS